MKITLTTLTDIGEVIGRCAVWPYYKVGFAFSSAAIDQATELILKELNQYSDVVVQVRRTARTTYIQFSKGGSINIFFGTESCRGKALHKLYIDPVIEPSIMHSMLLPLEKLTYSE